jgi:cyanate permease
MAKRKRYFLDKPENVTTLWRIFLAVCAVLLIVDLVHHRHVSHPWESLLGFYALFGFIGIVLLIMAAKQLRRLVARKENYYDDDDR